MVSAQAQPHRPERHNPSLLPREHGIYAEVAFPILTALWIGRPSLAGACFAIAVIAAFLIHEPVLVLLGRRGAWVRASLGGRAKRYVEILGCLAVVCGLVGVWQVGTTVRIAFLVLMPLALPLAFMTASKQEKSLPGETLIALIVSLASVPIAMAGGASLASAVAAAGVWFVVFVFSTMTVHAILARTKRRTERPAIMVASAAVLLAAGAVVGYAMGGLPWLLAMIPAPFVCAGVVLGRLPVKRLKVLGWLLVLGNLATAIVLILTL